MKPSIFAILFADLALPTVPHFVRLSHYYPLDLKNRSRRSIETALSHRETCWTDCSANCQCTAMDESPTTPVLDATNTLTHDCAAPHRHTKTPPPIPASRMTPPPSSQAGLASTGHRDLMRTPTPTHSHLSSPPPTVKGGPSHHVSVMATIPDADETTPDFVGELRVQLADKIAELQRARAITAHTNIQFTFLWAEHNEFKKRMDVELEMSRKEVEVLRERELEQRASLVVPMTPNARPAFPSPSDQELIALRNRCAALQIDNDKLRDRIDDLADYWPDRERDLLREIKMLRNRIRENRIHFNMIRAAGGPRPPNNIAYVVDDAPSRASRQTPLSQPVASNKRRGLEAIDQILLADRLLSQNANTTPSTPTPHSRRSHHRGAQSLSSLPSTPTQPRSIPQSSRNPNYYQTPISARTPQVPQTAPILRGRLESRDSTISASDVSRDGETFEGEDPSVSDSGAVVESRASQEAASILRKSTSFGRSVETSKSSGLLQTKIYGKVTKPALRSGERKPSASPIASQASPTKKRNEGVGLGIGRWPEGKRV